MASSIKPGLGGESLARLKYNATRLQTHAVYLNAVRRMQRREVNNWRIRPGRIDGDQIPALPGSGWKAIRLYEAWGGDRVDCLWHAAIKVDEEFRGKPVFLGLDIGAEALVFVNGKAVKGLTPFHPDVRLLASARGGEKLEVVLEAHSGWIHPRWGAPHGWHGGYHIFRRAELFTTNPTLDKLYYLVLVLSEHAASPLGDNRLTAEALAILKDIPLGKGATPPEFFRAVPKVLRRLENLKATPLPRETMMLGHSHLDIAYLWPVKEGVRKHARTVATACNHIEDDKNFTFALSQAFLGDELKRHYPYIFRRLKKAVKTGRLELVGGMWVEADLNATSGESIVRQILYGQRFFQKEFGGHSRIMWLPDCFGFGHALPQIMKLAGMKYFFAAKLNMGYPPTFPHRGFRWRGQDNSEVIGFLSAGYGGAWDMNALASRLQHAESLPKYCPTLITYGYSDGGQGVTLKILGKANAMQKIFGSKAFHPATAANFFSILEKQRLPLWSEELYLNAHQGTFTTSALSKMNNRRAEELLHTVEALSVLAGWRNQKQTEVLWKQTLVQQFHDILPGDCVQQVLDESLAAYRMIFDKGGKMKRRAAEKSFRCGRSTKMFGVFNSAGIAREDYCVVTSATGGFCDDAGAGLSAQKIGNKTWLVAPGSLGAYAGKIITRKTKVAGQARIPFLATLNRIRTPFYDARLRRGGILESLVCRNTDRVFLKNPSNVFQLFIDENTLSSAWDIVPDFESRMRVLTSCEEWRLENAGPLRATYFSRRCFGNSEIRQHIHFYRDLPRIDFETEIDWHENAKLLKVAFFPDVESEYAYFETHFGFIRRRLVPRNVHEMAKFEVPHFRWACLPGKNHGVALLNDCKYGIDAKPSMLRLSLLRAPDYPNPAVDQGKHKFTYSLYPYRGDFANSRVVESALELNMPLFSAKNARCLATREIRPVKGRFIIDTVKWSEEGSRIILRVYEPYHRATRGALWMSGARKIWEADLLESPLKQIKCQNGFFSFDLHAAEIKTFLLELDATCRR